MNKGRVEAFTDAVVAIIMTIMILEFKTPDSFIWTAILADLPYLFAYSISFLFMGVAWYNHHYMFALATRITKKIYWINNLWLFTMSMIPVTTAWTGRFIDHRGPEYFYLLIFFFWSVAYLWLSQAIAEELETTKPERATKIRKMPPFQFMSSWRFPAMNIATAIGIYFFPPICLIVTLIELIYMAFHTTPDSDRILSE